MAGGSSRIEKQNSDHVQVQGDHAESVELRYRAKRIDYSFKLNSEGGLLVFTSSMQIQFLCNCDG